MYTWWPMPWVILWYAICRQETILVSSTTTWDYDTVSEMHKLIMQWGTSVVARCPRKTLSTPIDCTGLGKWSCRVSSARYPVRSTSHSWWRYACAIFGAHWWTTASHPCSCFARERATQACLGLRGLANIGACSLCTQLRVSPSKLGWPWHFEMFTAEGWLTFTA